MFGLVKRLLVDVFCGDDAPPPPRQRLVPGSPLRPLERLESRENPADATFLGGPFGVPASWSPAAVPTATSTIIVDGPLSNNADLTFPQVGAPGYSVSFADIQMRDNYAGNVAFPANVTFNNYHQAGGRVLLFGGSARTITVKAAFPPATTTSQFMWTGGDIVGSGKYVLKGVTDSYIGEDSTTLDSDASFDVDKYVWWGYEPGSRVSSVVQRGKLRLHAGAAVSVINDSFLTQFKQNVAATTLAIESNDIPSNTPGIVLASNGNFISFGGIVPSVTNNGGTVVVATGGLTVTGKAPGTNYGVVMTAATSVTTIVNGETLKATHGVYMQNGWMYSNYNTAPGVSQIATIDGTFTMEGGTVQLGMNPPSGTVGYSTLKIKKSTELLGGTFVTKLHATLNTTRDAIDTDDTFKTSATFTIQPSSAPAAGTSVLVSAKGFIVGSVLPSLPTGSTYTLAWDPAKKIVTIS